MPRRGEGEAVVITFFSSIITYIFLEMHGVGRVCFFLSYCIKIIHGVAT